MLLNGWIKIHRKFTEWEWYGDVNTKTVFLHLILTANFEATKWRGLTLERGQVVVGRKALAETLGLSEQNIRTALDKLESTGEISRQATNKFTIVTICKYEQYQQIDESEQPTTNQQVTNNQPTTNHSVRNKEYKNITEEEVTHACAYERKPVGEYLTEALMDDTWVEATCMNHRIDKFTIVKLAEDFKTECKCNGHETEDSIRDTKYHFNNWLRIRIEAERKQQKQKEQNGTTSKKSIFERAGYDVSKLKTD